MQGFFPLQSWRIEFLGASHAQISAYLHAGHWLRWRRTAYVQFDTSLSLRKANVIYMTKSCGARPIHTDWQLVLDVQMGGLDSCFKSQFRMIGSHFVTMI